MLLVHYPPKILPSTYFDPNQSLKAITLKTFPLPKQPL